jgi:mxaJ protein
MRAARLRVAAAVLACLAGPALAQVEAAPPRKAFRVCQDPNNLPFSNEKGEGLENRLAEVFGKALGLPVTYYSYPQRMGFIRNTLRFKAPGEDFPCDVVMGWPPDSGPVASTKPYYQSTYAMVLRKDRVSTSVATIADFLKLEPAQLKRLRIGLYDRSPASEWLARHDLVDQGVPYKMMNADPAQYAGEIIDRELAEGRIDAAIVWGPIAGYYAKRVTAVPLVVLPLKSEPGVKLNFSVAVGVRPGEGEWKQQVQSVLDTRRPEILAILREYGVPLVNEAGEVARD